MKKLLLLIPLVVFIVGCGEDEEGTVFYPLSVGNEWNFDMTMTETTPSDTFVVTGTQNQEITAETTLDDSTAVFEMLMTMTFDDTLVPDMVDTSYMEETEDYLLDYDTKADTVPDTVAVLPPEVGKSWTVDHNTTAEYISQESVTVPAGTFSNCWKMVHIDSGATDTTWIYVAEDVGPVKINWIEVEADTTDEMLMELETYTVQ